MLHHRLLRIMKPDCVRVAPVFLEYREHLLRYIQSKVHDTDLAEEILSQVMLKVYNNCEQLASIRNTQAWMVTVARNAIVDHFRSSTKHAELTHQVVNQPDHHTATLEKSLAECVEPMIRQLPAIYSEPMLKHEIDGVSQKVLARQYGLSHSGMKSRIQRGRRLLREAFLAL